MQNAVWKNWEPATCVPNCWCELPRYGHWVLEPSNTLSNLTYILVAIAVLWHQKKRHLLNPEALMAQKPIYYTLFSLSLVVVGLGSGWFHASQTYTGQWLDNSGMFLITNLFILYNLDRIKNFSAKTLWTRFILLTIPMMFMAYFVAESRRYLFAASLLCAVVLTLFANKKQNQKFSYKFFYGAIGLYLIAQTSWLIDKLQIICKPTYWLNGHAIWHFFTALACYCYLYFLESQRPAKKQTSGF